MLWTIDVSLYLDYLSGVYCHYLYLSCLLAVCAGCFASVVLISIKNTRIIAGGYHSIRLVCLFDIHLQVVLAIGFNLGQTFS